MTAAPTRGAAVVPETMPPSGRSGDDAAGIGRNRPAGHATVTQNDPARGGNPTEVDPGRWVVPANRMKHGKRRRPSPDARGSNGDSRTGGAGSPDNPPPAVTIAAMPRPHTALYAGSFDPMTSGHLDVLGRARRMFDRIVVGIGNNPAKSVLFSL
ncbi:MAG: adenylyltransferase/cytidyltransferase family protein, partial [Phycisphaerales bacterium]|nr:adenylyltransferase/cytidyltransferase family protein [Phycisphaerales bacterium]